MISYVADDADAMDGWIAEMCDLLRANGLLALAACKRILTEVAGVHWDQVQARTAERIAEIRVSPEGQEGLKAFLEKRPPRLRMVRVAPLETGAPRATREPRKGRGSCWSDSPY